MVQVAYYLNFLTIIFHFQHFVTVFFDKISTISQMPILGSPLLLPPHLFFWRIIFF